MGRRPDPPELQAAKGNPGKRTGKMKARAVEAERIAELLSSAPSSDVMSPPVLSDPMFAPALVVWRELAPELHKTHRLPKESRLIFVQLCVYMAEWLGAEVDIAEHGYTQRVKTVAGGYMERKRPVVDRRERAFDNVMRLSEEFGLTPHDLYALFKDQAVAVQTNPGLFDGQDGVRANAVRDRAPVETAPTVVGSAARLRSTPPASLPN
ncbi:P27 family phage terminase small subunit [Caulobacter sp. DWR3-1-2]|uniref:P27 family phage terminase small subunit n=1 Tax=Caulobacter sp. DWR3-1-2 TaxID=2804647 RepID=UPI003CF09EF1